jgi:Icc-related predicted phosphoesterase
MIRRLSVPWPTESPPLRLLAVSDEPERAFDFERNRSDVAPIDGILGAGDLEPDYLAFLADAFHAPLLYVRGNHDRGANWVALERSLPRPLETRPQNLAGVSIVGLGWPGERRGQAVRQESAAWAQAISVMLHLRGRRPPIIISHVPPRGMGDTPEDHYHRGFAAYKWLCQRINPRLWLHGHTALAATNDWRHQWGRTTLVNVTGAVLIELAAAPGDGATIAREGTTKMVRNRT